MEKVIVVHEYSYLNDRSVREVNDLLSKGWTVKHVVTGTAEGNVHAIFVLEKADTPYIPPKK